MYYMALFLIIKLSSDFDFSQLRKIEIAFWNLFKILHYLIKSAMLHLRFIAFTLALFI